METLANIKKISLFFFITIGFVHIISALIVSNNYFQKPFDLIYKTLDMPFIIAGLCYGLTSLKLNFYKNINKSKFIDIILILIFILVIGGIIYINLAVPDK
ncbi:hypothetical protein A2483_01475 [Candidatus Peregrinibacteria bacterium RIFOXYC2_FULL_33_13]|nr:MAG: hypothetical protein UR27_C0024G0011 [Candidatus Peregrinibacteria bacterium GW2011_GWA2_33_10]KKP38303.1 MAG: hypothetical protein UR30_C0021G0011 [Candidatus Peregrinibacteria bacterium GW2011_GWC2_33_13]OGJ46743.1 MAG: hypothetical protein A2229_01370 [Candidatus Peregrinibacteria bacterium RIFOXYA2_FULL_33_7]OGJ52828.1 MAG: hypothetical protein A2483_01475 [Candidatus Peregrinibacteria bacterium RIFOXYC2_FULL_33_13]